MGPRRWLGVAVAVTLVALPAAAQPTLWEVAARPQERVLQKQAVAIERILSGPIRSPSDFLRARHRVDEVLAWSGKHPDLVRQSPKLEGLLGLLLAQSFVGDYSASRRYLERAIAANPSPPVADVLNGVLGEACARVGATDCELAAYGRALELATDPNARATLLANRAEGKMYEGDLAGAVTDYRAAREASADPEIISLAGYGLAVAVERGGDLPSALKIVLDARAAWPAAAEYSPLDDPDVFFVPAFDLYYYKGLESLALARAAVGDRRLAAAARGFAVAAGYFEQYLAETEFAPTPWVPRARLHFANCLRERESLGVPDEPPPRE